MRPRSHSESVRLLDAQDPPLGPLSSCIIDEPSTLVIVERAFYTHGHNVQVTDLQGGVVCSVRGPAGMTLGGKRVFSDTTGTPVMTLSTNANPYSRVFIGTAGDTTAKAEEGQQLGKQLFTAKRKMGVKHHMTVSFTNAADQLPTTLELRGDVMGNEAAVLTADGRETVAHFTRSLDGRRENRVMTYYVSVAANVDRVLMAALCLAFVQAKDERRNFGAQ